MEEESSPDNSPRRLRRRYTPVDMEAILRGLRTRALAAGRKVKPRYCEATGLWIGENLDENGLPVSLSVANVY